MNKGQVVKIHSDFYYVQTENTIFECKLREILKKQKQKIFVGDYVEYSNGAIERILPRENFITRPAVANITQVIIISAVKEPELDYTQLDRYISFAAYHKLKTILCFNKNDLSSDDKIIEKVFSIYSPLGFDILFTSALEKDGIEEFTEILQNNVSVLCGSSGVGKSSLINATTGIKLKTKNISEKTKRGTHTTRHCEIISINKNSKVIDTPGFNNLKFDFLLPDEIDELFAEIRYHKNNCKYKNCLHIDETDCTIKSEIGKSISETRYNSYIEFIEEAKAYKEQVKYNGKKQETFNKQFSNKLYAKINSKKRECARNTLKQNIYKEITDERIN